MKIVSGEMYYYFSGAYEGIQMQIHLKEKVDGDILKEALKETLKVHPYLSWTVEEKNADFYYKETGKNVALINSEKYPKLGGEDLFGQLAAVVYYEKRIGLVFYHGLIDGVGARRALETLVYFYFCIKDGKEYPCDGIMTKPASEYPTLNAEPYSHKYDVDPDIVKAMHDEANNMPKDVFSLVGQKENVGDTNVIQVIKIPNYQFMDYSRSHNMSPSIALSLLICKAIQTMHPDNKNKIRVNIPISLRDALGISDTFRNTTGDVALFIDPEDLKAENFDKAAIRARQELKNKMNSMRLQNMANEAMDFLKMTGEYKTFKDRAALYENLPSPTADTIFISYMGKLQTSEYGDMIEGCDVASMPRDGFVFNIYDCGGCFNIVLTKKGTDASFAENFVNVCKEINLDAILAYSREYKLEYVSIREKLNLIPAI